MRLLTHLWKYQSLYGGAGRRNRRLMSTLSHGKRGSAGFLSDYSSEPQPESVLLTGGAARPQGQRGHDVPVTTADHAMALALVWFNMASEVRKLLSELRAKTNVSSWIPHFFNRWGSKCWNLSVFFHNRNAVILSSVNLKRSRAYQDECPLSWIKL